MAGKDPFEDLKRIRKEMDEIFLDLYMGPAQIGGRTGHAFRPAADVCYNENHDRVVVTFEIAGLEPDSLRVSVDGRTLMVEGKRRTHGHQSRFYHHMEIDHGAFRRKLMLPFEVESDQRTIEYQDGFLSLKMPASKATPPKDMPIRNSLKRGH